MQPQISRNFNAVWIPLPRRRNRTTLIPAFNRRFNTFLERNIVTLRTPDGMTAHVADAALERMAVAVGKGAETLVVEAGEVFVCGPLATVTVTVIEGAGAGGGGVAFVEVGAFEGAESELLREDEDEDGAEGREACADDPDGGFNGRPYHDVGVDP